MARTIRNVWPQVVSWDNLVAAYVACRRRKRLKPEVAAFEFARETNLLRLQEELVAGTYTPGAYRNFWIYEPKRRRISAAPFADRVVHHAIVRVLEPHFERRFIFDSYACRVGKGTHRALDRAQHFLRRYEYCLKTDIVKFFPNVDHAVLMDVLGNRISDRRLLEVIGKIIDSGAGVLADEATPTFFPGDDLFALLRPTGIPIGNLTSQFFANILLDEVDHFVKEVLRVPGYVRYADDLILFDDDKRRLWECHHELAVFLERLRLRLHPDKTALIASRAGVKFLGMRLWPNGRRLQQSALARFNRRLRRLRWLKAQGLVHPYQISASMKAWVAHASQANSTGIRRAIWKRVRFSSSKKPPRR